MASNICNQIRRPETDEWYTRPQDVELILPYLKKRGYKKILCPFDKEDSAFVKVLTGGVPGIIQPFGHRDGLLCADGFEGV